MNTDKDSEKVGGKKPLNAYEDLKGENLKKAVIYPSNTVIIFQESTTIPGSSAFLFSASSWLLEKSGEHFSANQND